MFLFLSSTTSALVSSAGQPVMSGLIPWYYTRQEWNVLRQCARLEFLSPALQCSSVTVSPRGLRSGIRCVLPVNVSSAFVCTASSHVSLLDVAAPLIRSSKPTRKLCVEPGEGQLGLLFCPRG